MIYGARKKLIELHCAIDKKKSEIYCNLAKVVHLYTLMSVWLPLEDAITKLKDAEKFTNILREHLPELAETLVHEITNAWIRLENCDLDAFDALGEGH